MAICWSIYRKFGCPPFFCLVLKPAVGCFAYSMILAYSLSSLALTVGVGDYVSRNVALVGVTTIALLPLCLLDSMMALTPYSLICVVCLLFTAGVMVVRSLDGSYAVNIGRYVDQIPALYDDVVPTAVTSSSSLMLVVDHASTTDTSALIGDVAATATTTNTDVVLSSSSVLSSSTSDHGIVLACTLATAFIAHYNAPRFYTELLDATNRANTVDNNSSNHKHFTCNINGSDNSSHHQSQLQQS
jgi:hypothetical protein